MTIKQKKLYGIVEGFFSAPRTVWNHKERLRIIRFMIERCPHLNTYFYCPKDDALVRRQWQKHYSPGALLAVKKASDLCVANGITFIYGLNPEFDLADLRKNFGEYVEKILWKLDQLQFIGISSFAILYDDIPFAYSVTADDQSKNDFLIGMLQAKVINALKFGLGKDAEIFFCPPDYFLSKDTKYIRGMRRYLGKNVKILWSGPQIFTPAITPNMVAIASQVAKSDQLIWWDNYPVNDCEHIRSTYHIGGFNGPSRRVLTRLTGIFMNPMREPFANVIALQTFDAFISSHHYDRENETRNAFRELMGKNWMSFYRVYISFSARSSVDNRLDGYTKDMLGAKSPKQMRAIIHRIRRDIAIIQTSPAISQDIKSFLRETRGIVKRARIYAQFCDALLAQKPWQKKFTSLDIFPVNLGNFSYRYQIMRTLKERCSLTDAMGLSKYKKDTNWITIEKVMKRYGGKSSRTITQSDKETFFTSIQKAVGSDRAAFVRSLATINALTGVKMTTRRIWANQYYRPQD